MSSRHQLDGGRLRTTPTDLGSKGLESRGSDVRKVRALNLGSVGFDDVKRVGNTPSAHCHIDPLAIGGAGCQGVSDLGSCPLSLVPGDGVAMVEVAICQVRRGNNAGFVIAVELDGQVSLLAVQGLNRGDIAVKDSEVRTVLEADHSVAGLVLESGGPNYRTVERPVVGECLSGELVERSDGFVRVGDEQDLRDVAKSFHILVP
jgi:hypothetical protein